MATFSVCSSHLRLREQACQNSRPTWAIVSSKPTWSTLTNDPHFQTKINSSSINRPSMSDWVSYFRKVKLNYSQFIHKPSTLANKIFSFFHPISTLIKIYLSIFLVIFKYWQSESVWLKTTYMFKFIFLKMSMTFCFALFYCIGLFRSLF